MADLSVSEIIRNVEESTYIKTEPLEDGSVFDDLVASSDGSDYATLVTPHGLEPWTPWLKARCSTD